MQATQVDLGSDLALLLQGLNQPLEQAVREMVVLELYRRAAISGGKAAELLGMTRHAFIQYSSRLGIVHLDSTEEELDAELGILRNL